MTFTHSCLKCQKPYQDEDPDPYYCVECQKIRKEIAAKVDAQIGFRPSKKPTSMLQEYDASPKVRGFVRTKL